MKKGLVGFLALSTLFSFAVVGNSTKVEAAESYVKVTDETLATGDYLVVANDQLLGAASTISSGKINGVDITINSDGTIDNGEYTVWTITNEGSYYTMYDGSNYLGYSSSTDFTKNATVVDNKYHWTITNDESDNYTILNVSTASASTKRQVLYQTSKDRFGAYASSNVTNADYLQIQLYKLSNGSSEEPDTPAVPEDKTEEVTALFDEYYGEGTYTKDSVLNTNKLADHEVAKYFHASADTKYRRTEYYPEGLTMTTSTDGSTYSNESIYTNDNGQVKHTGLGGNFTVNQPSVEDWFVTLKDFKDSTLEGWILENGVYTYTLEATTATTEHEMTRMAREFVAPMWLAPNAENYAYAIFDKLTVQEVNNQLVMKLYVENGDILVEGSNNVFSQITISKPTPDAITNIADALEAEEGTPVVLTGTVTEIYQAYNSDFGNISVYITDESGNRILCFRLTGNTNLHDIIEVTGNVTNYNGKNQVAQGATFDYIGTEPCEYNEATCLESSTCVLCGKEGEPALGHTAANSDGNCDRCGMSLSGDVEKVTATKTIKELIAQYGWTSSTTKQQFNIDENVSVKINGGSNTGKAYNNDHIRIYASDTPAGSLTFTLAEGCEFVSLKITTQTGTYAYLKVDGTGDDISNKTVALSGNKVVINSVQNGSNGKQARITGIEVVYTKA